MVAPRRGFAWRRLLALLVVAVAVIGGVASESAAASPASQGVAPDSEVTLTLFHGDGCPHCAAEIAYLVDEFAPDHPQVSIRAYEVWSDEANRAVMVDAAAVYGFEPGPVPVTIVEGPAGHQVIVGFGAGTPAQIEAAIVEVTPRSAPSSPAPSAGSPAAVVEVPLLGEVSLSGSSVLVSTLLIGFVDGINPCSLWVLSMLLAIVLHSRSRRRVALVGTVFLAVTAAMYGIYVAVFLLDELVVFGAAVLTLRSTKLQERHGQALKIVSGSLPVTLAAAMVTMPDVMQTVPGTLAVFAAAGVVGGLLWRVRVSREATRRSLPIMRG